MSASNFKWLIVYRDYTTQVVIAKSIDEIIYSENLDQCSEYIINIIRLELY